MVGAGGCLRVVDTNRTGRWERWAPAFAPGPMERETLCRMAQSKPERLTPELAVAAERGMAMSYFAERTPDRPILDSKFGSRTCAELNARVNQLARAFRDAGLQPGDAVALLLHNRPEFVEVFEAAQRTGLRLTPVNWHLTGAEVGYIVDNCEAKAFLAGGRFARSAVDAAALAPRVELRLRIGEPADGEMEGFDDYERVCSARSEADIEAPVYGRPMLYTSGTTGHPKGVERADREVIEPQYEGTQSDFRPGDDCVLLTGPAYHAAPLMSVRRAMVSGVRVVMMDKWDAEETLALIDRERVTHSHMVATMFHRMLKLPQEVRRRYDVSSMRSLHHGAAPCPVHVKHAMIEWFGPVIWEYYAATEGAGGFLVSSEEWLEKPGTVGYSAPEHDNKILDEDGNELPAGQVGTIYMRAPEQGRFSYFKDREKTESAYFGDHFTLGDMGYLDEDGYLFLTGRTAELIISGGVNIYPQEVDSVLMRHPAVHEVCTVGIPNDEWGEEVRSVVELEAGVAASDELSEELLAYAREHLAHYKCPRSIDYQNDLPRLPTGKIQRRKVREPYWEGRDRSI